MGKIALPHCMALGHFRVWMPSCRFPLHRHLTWAPIIPPENRIEPTYPHVVQPDYHAVCRHVLVPRLIYIFGGVRKSHDVDNQTTLSRHSGYPSRTSYCGAHGHPQLGPLFGYVCTIFLCACAITRLRLLTPVHFKKLLLSPSKANRLHDSCPNTSPGGPDNMSNDTSETWYGTTWKDPIEDFKLYTNPEAPIQ